MCNQERTVFPLLNGEEQKTLCSALHYMKMDELKDACMLCSVPVKGKKTELINRVMTFIKDGTIATDIPIPLSSRAKNYPLQRLAPECYMLYGSYKNDATTRDFFKKLIGSHFHFTAFGIDWLNDRWQRGLPPTYQEFADYWQQEMDRRKVHKVAPKDEWAFINFVQRMKKQEPFAQQDDVMHAWKEMQKQQSEIATGLLKKALRLLQQ